MNCIHLPPKKGLYILHVSIILLCQLEVYIDNILNNIPSELYLLPH